VVSTGSLSALPLPAFPSSPPPLLASPFIPLFPDWRFRDGPFFLAASGFDAARRPVSIFRAAAGFRIRRCPNFPERSRRGGDPVAFGPANFGTEFFRRLDRGDMVADLVGAVISVVGSGVL